MHHGLTGGASWHEQGRDDPKDASKNKGMEYYAELWPAKGGFTRNELSSWLSDGRGRFPHLLPLSKASS